MTYNPHIIPYKIHMYSFPFIYMDPRIKKNPQRSPGRPGGSKAQQDVKEKLLRAFFFCVEWLRICGGIMDDLRRMSG